MADAIGVDELCACGLARDAAERLLPEVNRALADPNALAGWRAISKRVLRPQHPHAMHQLIHERCFSAWQGGPAPAWVPSDEEILASNLGRVMNGDYPAFHRRSVEAPEAHWSEMLERLAIVAHRRPDRILDVSKGVEHARWLPGMHLNIAESALARDRARIAVVFQRAPDAPLERRTLGDLRDDATRVAAALHRAGFDAGDAIAIDMPMTYQAVVIYLGIVMLGAAVVSIADSFAAAEIATRLRIANAKGIFTQDVITRGGKTLPLYARVLEAAAPRAVVIPAGEALALELRAGDVAWREFLASAHGVLREPFHMADAEATTNVLFSSGTTGDPKAIPWTQLTPIKAAADGWGHHDIRPGDVVAWPTNLGWMMGPWLIYASLLNDAAMALYYGSPLERGFGAFVELAQVTMLGVVPSLVKAWRGSACLDGLDWSAIRCFSSTGEASSPDEMLWLMARAGYKPVIEYCGGTEIGGGYISGTVVQPQAPATFSTPALGCDFAIIDSGAEVDKGELALRPPMLGSSSRLLNADHHEVYFADMPIGPKGEVLRRHGDEMESLGGGYYRAHGRVDDTMNLGGIKTSSAEIERACNLVEGVHETAAIAVEPEGGGPSMLVVYAVLKAPRDELQAALQAAIRVHLNPLFKIEDVVVVDALPRTASNKVMRRVLRKQYRG